MYFKEGLSIVFDDETERLLIMDEFDGFVIGYYDDNNSDDFYKWKKCKTPFLIQPSRISPADEKLVNEITDGIYPYWYDYKSAGEILNE